MTSTAAASLPGYLKRNEPIAVRPIFVPLIGTAAATAAAWKWGLYPNLSDRDGLLAAYSAAASVGATLLGFMLAALAILASITHTHLVQMMQRSGHYGDLLSTLGAGCLVMLASTVLGFAMLFGVSATPFAIALMVGLHVGSLCSLIDTGRKFWMVMSHLRP